MCFFAKTVCWILCLAMAFPSVAHAYLDPGSGTIFVQLLASLAVGVSLTFQRVRNALGGALASFWAWIRRLISSK